MSKKRFEKTGKVKVNEENNEAEFGLQLRENELVFEEDDDRDYLTSSQQKKITGGKVKKRRKHGVGGHSFADVGRN